jgi:hypothetical protein
MQRRTTNFVDTLGNVVRSREDLVTLLNDYLDAYVVKAERDETVEIIRTCQRIPAEYPPERNRGPRPIA